MKRYDLDSLPNILQKKYALLHDLDNSLQDLGSLPNILQKKYALLHDLDKSLQGLIKQNEQRCEQEIEDIKRGVKSGMSSSKASPLRFSDEALDEQKHSIRIADEKVALAVQAYDLVDTHIQQLDQYLKKIDEELRRERDVVSGLPTSSIDVSIKSGRGNESGKGGRKKTRQATAAAVAAISAATEVAIQAVSNPIGTELDLPLDPNEPTYCFCNQVSFGEMVACDNPDCKIEWFHFGCVGLKEQPKGKWFCSDCAVSKSRRKAS